MKFLFIALIFFTLICLAGCNQPATSAAALNAAGSAPPAAPDAVSQKLREYSGSDATDCGRLDVKAEPGRSKGVADCALQASQNSHAFYVAYDMPGMTVGIAGNSAGKLFSVQSEGSGPSATLTSGDCPSELRLAASGRVTCFAPGDMGAMGGGHTAIPPGMPNPHLLPNSK